MRLIQLKREDGQVLWINADAIQAIEVKPPYVAAFINGTAVLFDVGIDQLLMAMNPETLDLCQ
jgi:uncharacterized protein YlzI (FlbEa/FlbD family)